MLGIGWSKFRLWLGVFCQLPDILLEDEQTIWLEVKAMSDIRFVWPEA
jgi:hypothetical protein